MFHGLIIPQESKPPGSDGEVWLEGVVDEGLSSSKPIDIRDDFELWEFMRGVQSYQTLWVTVNQ